MNTENVHYLVYEKARSSGKHQCGLIYCVFTLVYSLSKTCREFLPPFRFLWHGSLSCNDYGNGSIWLKRLYGVQWRRACVTYMAGSIHNRPSWRMQHCKNCDNNKKMIKELLFVVWSPFRFVRISSGIGALLHRNVCRWQLVFPKCVKSKKSRAFFTSARYDGVRSHLSCCRNDRF